MRSSKETQVQCTLLSTRDIFCEGCLHAKPHIQRFACNNINFKCKEPCRIVPDEEVSEVVVTEMIFKVPHPIGISLQSGD